MAAANLSKTAQVVYAALHVFGLSSFALCPPIFKALTGAEIFFLMHGADPIDVLVVTFVLAIASPLCFSVVLALPMLIHRRVHQGLHMLSIAVLIALYVYADDEGFFGP